jgi:hypothetical protein
MKRLVEPDKEDRIDHKPTSLPAPASRSLFSKTFNAGTFKTQIQPIFEWKENAV